MEVPKCGGLPGVVDNYQLDDGSGAAVQKTIATLCHDDMYLRITYFAFDDNVNSNYTHCHDPVWQADAASLMAL